MDRVERYRASSGALVLESADLVGRTGPSVRQIRERVVADRRRHRQADERANDLLPTRCSASARDLDAVRGGGAPDCVIREGHHPSNQLSGIDVRIERAGASPSQ